MPDNNPLAAKVPYERPELPNPGLSLIVQPTYYYEKTFPNDPSIENNGDKQSNSVFDDDYYEIC